MTEVYNKKKGSAIAPPFKTKMLYYSYLLIVTWNTTRPSMVVTLTKYMN